MTRLTKVAWAVFAAHCLAILIWAQIVHRRHPQARASAVLGSDGERFGRTLEQRKQVFQAMVAGEPTDRQAAAGRDEKAIWNRNRDSYFHQSERGRVPSAALRFDVPGWMAWWILDEGIRNHWPPPPGVALYADDAPLAPVTRPLEERHKIAETPR